MTEHSSHFSNSEPGQDEAGQLPQFVLVTLDPDSGFPQHLPGPDWQPSQEKGSA